jgi:heme exporter protein C
MQNKWWKWACVFLLIYTVISGFLGPISRQPILNETARNLYFHVTMWFAMIILLITSVVYSIKYLRTGLEQNDLYAAEFTKTGVLFGLLGCVTGSIWGNFTWGDPWPNDPKLNSVAIGMLIYFAYLILRGSLDDPQKKARVAAVYNIFAFAIFIPLIFILPRLTDSLHPGNGGNPGLKPMDTTGQMRLVFYPAIIGWTSTLKIRLVNISEKLNDK